MSLTDEILVAQARGWLSPTQNEALEKILHWLDHEAGTPALTLAGLAGTGKSSVGAVLSMLLSLRSNRLAILSPTWRAANEFNDRLRGLQWFNESEEALRAPRISAQTIHSFLYTPVTDHVGEIVSWKRKKFEPPFTRQDLLIIDEASMVDMLTFNDLAGLGARILLIGDPAQLPPVSRGDGCMGHLDIFLTEPHRQAVDSPILRLAYDVLREGYLVPNMMQGEGLQVLPKSWIGGSVLTWGSSDWVLLSYTNQARVSLNQQVREALHPGIDLSPDQLLPGDRVVSVKTRNQFYNSRTGTVVEIPPSADKREIALRLELEAGSVGTDRWLMEVKEASVVRALRAQFGNPRTVTNQELKDLKYDLDLPLPYLLDHGYAMTVHKAQGGGYDNVGLVLDGVNRLPFEERRAFLYTAVTRAKQTLTLFL